MKPIYKHQRIVKKPKKRIAPLVLTVLAVTLLTSYGFWLVRQPKTMADTPALQTFEQLPALPAPEINWPKYGQSAIGVVGYGVLSSKDETAEAKPMASIAKVMTILSVLKEKPLEPGQEGPTIIFNEDDERIYNEYVQIEGSVLPVKAGEGITQQQAIQASLIVSANNIADSLAIWAFGSLENYTTYANNYAEELGLINTNFADATGFSPESKATASDLVALGIVAMEDPLIREVVSTWQTKILDDLLITNTNDFLDFEGNMVDGIKSGYTDEALGTFLGSATYSNETGQEITVVSANLGARSHFLAQEDTVKIMEQYRKTLKIP